MWLLLARVVGLLIAAFICALTAVYFMQHVAQWLLLFKRNFMLWSPIYRLYMDVHLALCFQKLFLSTLH